MSASKAGKGGEKNRNGVQLSSTLDAAGNLIGDHEANVYEYDSDNRLCSYNYCSVDYDADGNTTYAYLDHSTKHFAYDSANRLIKAGDYTYTYNAEDVRIRSTNGTGTTAYVYDTNARLSRLLMKETDGTVTKYVYGVGLIGEIRTGVFKTYHFDYRGSTVAVTSECGEELSAFTYDTYGKLLSRTGTFKPIFLYNGRDGVATDPNGLLYMRARYYSPVLRRFMNADLLAGDISDARTLNRYSYVCGDPVSFVDPFGLSSQENDDFWQHIWDGLENKDGTRSLYDNRRSTLHRNNTFHEQIFAWDTIENDSNPLNGIATGIDFNLATGGWEYENVDLSLLDILNLSATFVVDPNSGLDISLSASIYSPSVTFSIENYTVTISLDLGVDLSLPFAFGEDWFQLNGTNWSIKIQREK